MARGKYSRAISDRSGMEFPYDEMMKEWTGAFVHRSEFESKHPQLESRSVGTDEPGLRDARPDRSEFATPIILRENPFTTSASLTSVLVFVTNDTHGIDSNPFQTGDAVRFTKVKTPVGGVAINTFELETTLNQNLTASNTTITLTDASNFPTSGYIVIEKVDTDPASNTFGQHINETIQYTGKSTNDLTGCTRGTAAPIQGATPLATTATTHNLGAKVFGSYTITRTTNSVSDNGITLTYSYSFVFDLVSAATAAEVGGGSFVLAGPVNERG